MTRWLSRLFASPAPHRADLCARLAPMVPAPQARQSWRVLTVGARHRVRVMDVDRWRAQHQPERRAV